MAMPRYELNGNNPGQQEVKVVTTLICPLEEPIVTMNACYL